MYQTTLVKRRAAIGYFLAAFSVYSPLLGSRPVGASAADDATFALLEARTGGRLGVFVRDTGSGRTLARRAHERFAMCSSFKASLAAAVLARVDAGRERLDRMIPYTEADLLAYAPVTRANVGRGAMSVEALCAAVIEVSDNGAANLLLATIGGPPELTRFWRRTGDSTTRLDRTEPTLNTAIPGDPRDTSTPFAMAASLQRFTLGKTLSPASRARLNGWMIRCTTGTARLRAGFPPTWRVGDKTGTGNQTYNDIAVVRRPHGAPLIVVSYITAATCSDGVAEATHASIARHITRMFP